MPRPRFSYVVLLALTLLFSGRAGAASNAAFITLVPESDGLTAAYHLDSPVTSLTLGRGPVAWQNPVWRVETPGMEIRGPEVRATDGHAFSDFTLRIQEDRRFVDRTYPVLLRLGDRGFLVYGPFLMARSAGIGTGLKHGIVTTLPTGSQALGGYFFVGPADYVTPVDAKRPDLGRLIARPDLPDAWRAEVTPGLSRALAYYRARLAPRDAVSPIIVYQDRPAPFLRGSVTGGGMLLLQIGGVWRVPRLELKPERDRLLAHEVFHLFLRRHDAADFPDWMNEGAADYATGLVTRHGALPTLGEVQIQLDLCVTSLGDRPLDSPATVARNRMPYACGFIAHWLVDRALRQGRTDSDAALFTLWADMATRDGVTAGDSLRQAAARAPAAARALSLLLTGSGGGRWALWAAAVSETGVPARYTDGPDPRVLLSP
ncbi:hypothetical protein [Nitrospirillum amazonense]|uniref:hypothetical protein n=1 Tax=Nitrospirillum amazonense TaxID=28077 RepID=UPI002412CA74|nr:hypothetical protein [Nitrospirillum amazonense]MDG3443684.1 hypothetical protein [Nitrospirillum amazonense]